MSIADKEGLGREVPRVLNPHSPDAGAILRALSTI